LSCAANKLLKAAAAAGLLILPALPAGAVMQAPLHYAPVSARLAGSAPDPSRASGASALELNPAGLAEGGGELALDYQLYVAEIRRINAGLAIPLGSSQALGLKLGQVDYGVFESTNELGESDGSFRVQDLEAGLGYGLKLNRTLSVGLGYAARNEDMASGQGWTSFANLGLRYQDGGFAAGAAWDQAVPNSGGQGQARAGASLRLGNTLLALAGAANGDSGEAGLGVSQQISALELKAGYVRTLPDPGLGWSDGLRAGLCVSLADWRLDYGMQWLGDYQASHVLGLRYAFAQTAAPASARVAAAAPSYPQAAVIHEPPAAPLAAATPEPVKERELINVNLLTPTVAKAKSLASAGQLAAAVQLYRQALAENPGDRVAWRGLASVYERAGRNDYAKACYQAVLKLDEKDAVASAWLAKNP
jgi:tetratricopeptide (TPR) repeat protein